MTATDTQRRLATIPEAAAHVGRSLTTIKRRLNDGTLTRYRESGGGRMVRIDLDELEAAFTFIAEKSS